MLRRGVQFLIAMALLAAVAVGASAIAGFASNGDSSSTSSTTTPTAPSWSGGGPGSPGRHPGETALTGDTAEKVRTAALDKVPGATVLRVETDAEGSPYEAHIRKSDGSIVTVKVDKQFTATDVQSGFGPPPAGAQSARPGGSVMRRLRARPER
jgi:hypothetical protein